MAKLSVANMAAPAVGGFSGIMLADILSGWLASTKVAETTGAWTPVVTCSLVGCVGLAFIPSGSAAMKAGGIAFAGASFGLAISSALRAMGILA